MGDRVFKDRGGKMKITVKTLSDKALARRGFQNILELSIDDKPAFLVYDGRPEDSALSKNFHDCFSVADLMEEAWEAGKRGEPFEIETARVETFKK